MNTFKMACFQACALVFIASSLSAQIHPLGAHFSKRHPDFLTSFPEQSSIPADADFRITSRNATFQRLDSVNTPMSGNFLLNSELYKHEFHYDQHQNNTEQIQYSGNNGKWLPAFKRRWIYNEDNQVVKCEYEQHLQTGWFMYNYDLNSYNANNQLSESIRYYWDYDSLNWYPTSKTGYNYGVN